MTEALENALKALQTYEWGSDPAPLEPIDKVVFASQPGTQKELEARLAAVLKTGALRAAKDFVCRKLALIGSAQSVSALSALLPDKELSHMARYALEAIGTAEAENAMRDSLPKVEDKTKIGVIHSLGVKRDARSTSQLAALLRATLPDVAAAAAFALGQIGTPEAAKALAEYRARVSKEFRAVAADASFVCAQRLLAKGQREEAMGILRALGSQDQPEHVRAAAKHALSAASRV